MFWEWMALLLIPRSARLEVAIHRLFLATSQWMLASSDRRAHRGQQAHKARSDRKALQELTAQMVLTAQMELMEQPDRKGHKVPLVRKVTRAIPAALVPLVSKA